MRKALYNAKFYLSRAKFAEAILIEDGRILQVGTNQAILAADNLSQSIDCQGHCVLPGFNDSHLHLMLLGEYMNRLQLSNCHSIAALIEAGRNWLADHPEQCLHGLYASGWNQDHFTSGERRKLTRHDLDQISLEIPVIFERSCGHVLVTNSKAIELLGLSASSPQYKGGVFEIGSDSQPNGIFAENACSHAIALIPQQSPAQQRQNFISAMHYAISKGITSVQSNDIGYYTKDKAETIELIKSVFANGEAQLRCHFQVCPDSPEELQTFIKSGILSSKQPLSANNLLTSGALKLFKDGSLGARTAMLRHSYLDDAENTGIVTTTAERFDEYCQLAARNGIQIVTHAIGDRAVEEVLNGYEKVLLEGRNPLRHSLIHCQITDQALLERIAKLGIYVQYQPIFINNDLHIVEQRVGRQLASTSYAFRSLQDLGGHISYGSDAPFDTLDPLANIYCAVTRKDLNGYPSHGWNPQERVDVYSAIDAYTLGSAEVQFMEKEKGRIAPGFLADLCVLDRDIFSIPQEEIKDIHPIQTFLSGECVWHT